MKIWFQARGYLSLQSSFLAVTEIQDSVEFETLTFTDEIINVL